MKKLFLLLTILIIASCGIFAQDKVNIKKAMDYVEFMETIPFYRLKTDPYNGPRKCVTKEDFKKNDLNKIAWFTKEDNYYGLPFYGYLDFHNTEVMISILTKKPLRPNLFKSDRKFKSAKENYYLMPFRINASGGYDEDILLSCNKNSGDVADILFVGQGGNNKNGMVFIRQWGINTKKEVTVYELKITTTVKTYFETAPQVINMKRIDTTYQIDDNGKFYVVSKKEYKPKDYRCEDLYSKDKNIWEGDEVPIN